MKTRWIWGAALWVCLTLAGAVAVPAPETVTPPARMLRFPDVGRDRIVFVYAGDLWTVPRTGGLARRLSSPPGHEQFPKISPDNRWLAFSGNYDGNIDVYVMPIDGGVPRRLTHHPEADVVVDWYPDGRAVLYRSRMYSPSRRFNRFFRQPVAGGMPAALPLAYGELGSFSPDGTQLVFQFTNRQSRNWKRYRGGLAGDLWIYDFKAGRSRKITRFPGTDAVPMWYRDTIYFLSDRDENKKLNIWAYNVKTGAFRQVTHFTDYDVKWPSIGPDAIVFENGGAIYLLTLPDEQVAPVSIQVPADLPELRPRLKDLSKNIYNFQLSPTGKRALFEARGEVLTVPAKHGSVRNLTRTSGVAERFPAWSPDGRWIAYFADTTGEYELYLRSPDGKGKPRQITHGGSMFRYQPLWSPDSQKIAYSDKAGNLWYVNIKDGPPQHVDKDDWTEIRHYAWSPDSRWLAYAKTTDNGLHQIRVFDTRTGRSHALTHAYYNDFRPVFSTDGKYLFFFSNRILRPIYGDFDATWVYPNSTALYAATLTRDLPSPLAPRSDEEKPEQKKKPEGEKQGPRKGKQKKEQKPVVRIDIDGFEARAVKLPVHAGNVGALFAVKGKVVFVRYPAAGAAPPGKPAGELVYYDLDKREEKTVIKGIDTAVLSADGKKVLYRSRTTFGIVDLASGKKVGDGRIATDRMRAWIDPRAEWKQIFTEAWRIERDYFYDPDMHGLDWEAIRKRYSALLPYVVDRQDLNYVIGEMIAELNASHTYVGGGDIERPPRINVGLLGCDFEFDAEHDLYRFKKIYQGAPWDTEVRSPLREPGIDVREGEYLLAVNGTPLDPKQDPWAAFQGLAGEVVTLTVNNRPTMEGAREVTVKPLESEWRLRNRAWIEANRRKVEEATKGRVGYVYVPDTSINGQSELVRQFIPQMTKDGLIIDERFNSGGQIPDRFIELLNRPIYNYWARRDFVSWRTPFVAHDGPKVMLINQWSGSGGDAFPYYFRKAGLGPLVGKRTWGGLIGISGNPRLIDGGFVTAPTFGLWNTEGKWDVEGYGVDPDVDLENPPEELARGRDRQLDKAIEIVLEQLKKKPPRRPHKPPYPDRSH